MVEASCWSCKGTPLNPIFKKPVELKVKKKQSSSSSPSSEASSSNCSSEEGLGTEHRLQRGSPGIFAELQQKRQREAWQTLHARALRA